MQMMEARFACETTKIIEDNGEKTATGAAPEVDEFTGEKRLGRGERTIPSQFFDLLPSSNSMMWASIVRRDRGQ
jgi:hypothetical protein